MKWDLEAVWLKKSTLTVPRSFFFPGAPFLGSKMGSEMVSSTLKKIIKIILKKIFLLKPVHVRKKMRKSAPPKNTSTWGESKKHCKDQSNTAKSTPWYSTTFFNGWRPQIVLSFPTYGSMFLPAIFASFLAKPLLKYTRTQMPSECPLSHPFSSEFSFGPCNCLFNFIQACPTN